MKITLKKVTEMAADDAGRAALPKVRTEVTEVGGEVRVTCSASVKITRKDTRNDAFVSIEASTGVSMPVRPDRMEKDRAHLVEVVQAGVIRDLGALSGRVDAETGA